MERNLSLFLKDVSPVPESLRANKVTGEPLDTVAVNLGQLYHHYFFDSFPSGGPKPDPSRFEYLEYLASTPDFRFHSYVADAASTWRRGLSTGLGQAFCRWTLDTHFHITYFAHMGRILDKPTHPGFEGLRVARVARGDTPDYLCARKVTAPSIAEAKGRFSAISFHSTQFANWRKQFSRIQVRDRLGRNLQVKGYIVATRLTTESNMRTHPALYLEDPVSPGDEPLEGAAALALGRAIAALHYGTVLRKLDLHLLASALENGGTLASELTFQAPVWTCVGPPCAGMEFVGGYYQTIQGHIPVLTEDGWKMPLTLGAGHAVFVGLEKSIAIRVSEAARGYWGALDELPVLIPEGSWSSDFSWLRDGTVLAPLQYFAPTGFQSL
jgi:hypothetical protein